MIRCDICGKPVEVEHGDDRLVVLEEPTVEADDIDDSEAVDALVRALRYSGDPVDHAAAHAYEEKGEVAAHKDCYEKTSIEFDESRNER